MRIGTNDDLFPQIEVGDIAIVAGRSSRGKSRVHEHGMEWRVKAFKGYNLLTFSVATGYKRWINGPNDPDFEVQAVKKPNFTIGAVQGRK